MAQGTVKHYNETERTGSLLMDDRSEIGIDAASTEGQGIRLLRIGQRVIFDLADASGQKVARRLRLVTFE
jgi:cold shock CspA family protein